MSAHHILVVKSSGKETEYADLLVELLGKLPDYTVLGPVTEEEYQARISSGYSIKEKTIFFGNGKLTAKQEESVENYYDCYGMKYGWQENRCVISANAAAVSSLQQQGAFADYYNSRISSFKELVSLEQVDANIDSVDEATKSVPMLLFAPPIFYGLMKGIEVIVTAKSKAEMRGHQYELIICEFMLNGLQQFMENQSE